MTDRDTVKSISRRINGVAGEFAFRVTVSYPGEDDRIVTFQSSDYGPPIVMTTPAQPRGIFISRGVLDRIGSKLTPEWIRAFFAPRGKEEAG
jgi:hypothetical protein